MCGVWCTNSPSTAEAGGLQGQGQPGLQSGETLPPNKPSWLRVCGCETTQEFGLDCLET